jgi:hypothetical protein
MFVTAKEKVALKSFFEGNFDKLHRGGAMAVDGHGQACSPLSDYAEKWCLMGAGDKLFGDGIRVGQASYETEVQGEKSLGEWLRSPECTPENLMRMIEALPEKVA